jgi:imidazolonepropionase-like amidohydrolase
MKLLFTLTAIVIFHCTFGQTYAIIADRLIDCKNERALNNPTIIVHDKKILDINYENKIPDSAVTINLKGYTVLPGMMDAHTHLLADGADYDKDLYNNSPSYRALRATKYLSISLQNGFTTLRDVCTEGAGFADVDLKKAVDSGFIPGPRIFPSGRGIAATGNYVPSPFSQNWELSLPSGAQYVSGTDECLKAVREQMSRGVWWIKIFADWYAPTLNYDEIKTIVTEAEKYHVHIAAHATLKEGIRTAILAGARSIEHGDEFNDSLIQLALKNKVFWCPTITVEEYFHFHLDSVYKYLRIANQQKLKIVAGTDAGSFPWTVNEAKELEYYVKNAGFTPMDAIKTATINTAELLGIDNELGQLQKDFLADIIAVKGNPLEDISLLQHVEFVMKEGKIYKQPPGK